MSITRHKDSHLDHNLTDAQVEFVLSQDPTDKGDGPVKVFSVELPEELGTVPCGLFGPIMGDDPIPESDDVLWKVRGDRPGPSRTVAREPRQVRTVTIVCGPHDGHDFVLFTAYGGPQAPREPFEDKSPEARKFWEEHALAG